MEAIGGRRTAGRSIDGSEVSSDRRQSPSVRRFVSRPILPSLSSSAVVASAAAGGSLFSTSLVTPHILQVHRRPSISKSKSKTCTMVLKENIYRNDTVYPKRVLDVPATLASKKSFCFVVPDSWDFHIISHTWTDGIRQLVKDCSAILSGIGWTRDSDSDGSIYMQTITASDFSGKSYYPAITEFLTYLAADGVEKVWLDAVCINQYDSTEMASEMHYMGGFYSLTNGCYVAPHGIGSENGYKGLTVSGNTLPRWFTRVWTLQEYILPEKLYFLVEKFEEDVLEYIEKEVDHPEDKAWLDWDSGEDLSSYGLFNTGSEGDYSRRKVDGASGLYFLGAMAYFEMMGTLMHVHVHGFKDAPETLFRDFYEAFGELAGGVEEIHMETLVKQIRVRYASSEEDRVLGILGLIGFKGEYSLQTGQTVDAQLVGLAKLMHTQEHVSQLIVNLCAAEYEGYEVNGISWAPDLFADPDDSRAQFRRYFVENYVMVKEYLATITGVEDDGSLIMKAQATHGKLNKIADSAGGVKYEIKVGVQTIPLLHDSDLADNLPIHAYATESCKDGKAQWYGGVMVAAPGIEKLKGRPEGLTVSDVTLVLLGLSDSPRKRTATCVLMVCIPLSKDPLHLHKIGAIHPHSSLASRVRKLFSTPASSFSVGGVGGDLTTYLHPDCQSLIKSLSSSSS